MVLETLKSRDEICNVLSDPIPSATQIVQDAEKNLSCIAPRLCGHSRLLNTLSRTSCTKQSG